MTAVPCVMAKDISTIFLPTDQAIEESRIDTSGRTVCAYRWPSSRARATIITFPGVSGEDNDWIAKTLPLLWKVAELPENWDGEGSPGTSLKIIDAVERLLSRLEESGIGDIPVPFVCPVAGGGVQLEWSSSRRHLEMEFLDASTIAFLQEERTPQGEETDTGEYPVTATEKTRQLLNWFGAV